jgi:hypothetical protein
LVLTAIVIDDIAPRRRRVGDLVTADRRFELRGEAENPTGMVGLVTAERPDLVLVAASAVGDDVGRATSDVVRAHPFAAVVAYSDFRAVGAHHAVVALGTSDHAEQSGIDRGFIDALADCVLRDHAPTDLDIRVGPERSSLALAWLDNAIPVVNAVHQNQSVLEQPLPEETWAGLLGLLRTWRHLALGGRAFYWAARGPEADVTAILDAGATLIGLPEAALVRLGVHRPGPAGQAFEDVLLASVLGALAARQADAGLRARLDQARHRN